MEPVFQYFGGKRSIVDLVWERLGKPAQYIEPFCGSAAMLLGAPHQAGLEVIGDMSGFIANFWRAVSHQPEEVAKHADYPVIHVDLDSRHKWLMDQRERIASELTDPHHPGDAQVAGWWVWGQCAWIGSDWCDWDRVKPLPGALGQIPHVSDAGRGIHSTEDRAVEMIRAVGRRLKRVRVIHGSWDRTLNLHYGTRNGYPCVFLDPPYKGFANLYGAKTPDIENVVSWCKAHERDARIALCGHTGDYDLPGWEVVSWKRARLTMGSGKTRDKECLWFSPPCLKPSR